MSHLAWIGLGSNLGDRKAHLDLAVAELSRLACVTVRAVSPPIETSPVGGPAGQSPFLNAAAALETTLDPEALLDVLQFVERRAGRVRTVRWAERTLDLDLLLYADQVVNTSRLQVPHPRMALRRFVLAPLAEIAPDAVDPITGRTVANLLANLDRRPGYVAIGSQPAATRVESLLKDVRQAFRNLGPFPCYLHVPSHGPDPAARLCERLAQQQPTVVVEPRILGERNDAFSDATEWWSTESDPCRFADELLISLVFHWLNVSTSSRLASVATWIVSPFWFDAQFLTIDTLKPRDPRCRSLLDCFLAAREHVLSPTFVVVRRGDFDRYRLHDSRFSWRRPIGWDTPVLKVEEFDSDEAVSEVLTTCAATRP